MLRRRRPGAERDVRGGCCGARGSPAGSTFRPATDGLAVDLHVVVEYGLNLAEVAATVRTRVAYEVERQTGLRVAAVEVHVDDVRESA